MAGNASADLRLAVVGTGRSGTNWLMLILSHLYDAYPFGVPDWDPRTGLFMTRPPDGMLAKVRRRIHPRSYSTWDGLWSILPRRFVLHAHWMATEPVVEELGRRDVRVITMARHPFDVLLSHLAWVNRSRGDIGLPFLKDATPRSPAFIDFATGLSARYFLNVSRGWWQRPGVPHLKYEDLIDNPGGSVETLAEQLGEAPRRTIIEALDAGAAERLQPAGATVFNRVISSRLQAALLAPWSGFVRRAGAPAVRAFLRDRNYYWRGTPGTWKRLLTTDEVHRIYDAQREIVDFFGYTCDPDLELTPEQADANWYELLGRPAT